MEDLKCRIKAGDVHKILEEIILLFKNKKLEDESFGAFINRIGISIVKDSILNKYLS